MLGLTLTVVMQKMTKKVPRDEALQSPEWRDGHCSAPETLLCHLPPPSQLGFFLPGGYILGAWLWQKHHALLRCAQQPS